MKNLIGSILLFTFFCSILYSQESIEVHSGWNMIGGITTMPASGLRSIPPDIIISGFYGFSTGGYAMQDSIIQGKGYWVKASHDGRLLPQNKPPVVPYNPFPSNQDTGVYQPLTLHWSCYDPDGDTLTYNVFFGTDYPPTTQISSHQSETSISRSGLTSNTTYYWQVQALENNYLSESPIWSFTTAVQGGAGCPSLIVYENKTYHIGQIGTQCWFKENLDIGTQIMSNDSATDNIIIEKYCYNDDPANCTSYGGLYKWIEAMQYSANDGEAGICPTGSHIPMLTDITTLIATVSDNGNNLKAIGEGAGSGSGTNTSGFSALLAGYMASWGTSYNLHYYTYFWTSSQYESTSPFAMILNGIDSNISTLYFDRTFGYFGVRCILD